MPGKKERYVVVEKVDWMNVAAGVFLFFIFSIPIFGPWFAMWLMNEMEKAKKGHSAFKRQVKLYLHEERR